MKKVNKMVKKTCFNSSKIMIKPGLLGNKIFGHTQIEARSNPGLIA